jgi:DNA-binding transcriptional ArsR family regulator
MESMTNPTENELKVLKDTILNDGDRQFLMDFLEAIGNQERLNILELLKLKPYNVSELEEKFNKSQSTISHHLKILEQKGLIRGEKKGKFTQYALIKEVFDKMDQLWKKWGSKITNWMTP